MLNRKAISIINNILLDQNISRKNKKRWKVEEGKSYK